MNPEDEMGALEFDPAAACRLLYPLARPAGSLPVPPAFEAALATDARARASYDAGDYLQAATLFLEVAECLRLPVGEPYCDTFTANRALTYANAVAAWNMSGKLDEARRALDAAASEDPSCSEAIDRFLTES